VFAKKGGTNVSRKSALIGSTALAAVIGLAMARLGMAAPPGEGECRGNSCNSGFDNSFFYNVAVETDAALDYPFDTSICYHPVFNPNTDGFATTNGSSVNIYFERHNECATFFTSHSVVIDDDIYVLVGTDNRNQIVSIQIFGQHREPNADGFEEIMHRSDVIEIVDPIEIPFLDGIPMPFDVVLDATVRIYNCGHPLRCKKNTDFLDWAGDITVGKMIYTPEFD